MRRFRDYSIAGLTLVIFVLALFSRLLFTDRVLASGDILHYFYPYRDYAAAALRAGRIPLWNPYIFSGVPFLANPQAAVLYPLHWPLSWLSVTKQIYAGGALHAWILGLGGYALLRRWGYGLVAGLMAGLVLAGSGFYGGLLGHINQMNAAAWLPWLVLVVETTDVPTTKSVDVAGGWPRLFLATALFALLVALTLLAGHTQTAYINLFGVGVWVLVRGMPLGQWLSSGQWLARDALATIGRAVWPSLRRTLPVYFLGVALAVLLAAAQLLPTLALSGLGLRSGGLSYGEASSFSLKPLHLHWTLLPSYGLVDLGVVFNTSGYTEFVAYVGLTGLALAALALWRPRRRWDRAWTFGLLFAGLGIFLALGRWNPFYFLLYKLVPGFDLFRAPARWMMLYTLGMAVLAGIGADRLAVGWVRKAGGERRLGVPSPLLQIAVVAAVAFDLILAARSLPHTHPTAPQAVYDVRTAVAHLLTDPARSAQHPAAMGRFLSMSAITFDPGDMADWRRIYRETPPVQLDEAAFADLIVALKSQEILAPNLSLLWRIPAVDGFDGGVLPLQRYIRFLTLFLPAQELVPDGRLREQVQTVPDTALLNLLNVRYVITDKVRDLWYDGVYYDRQLGAKLDAQTPLDVAVETPFAATAVGILGYVSGPADALARWQSQNHPVAQVQLLQDGGVLAETNLIAGGQPGAHFADDRLDSPMAVTARATVAYRDVVGGHQEYLAWLPLFQSMTPDQLRFRPEWLPPGASLTVQAVTLVDERTGTFQPLLPSDRGRFRLVHSGDVKIYENVDVRPRAYLVSQAVAVASAQEALVWLQKGADTARTAVVEASPEAVAQWHLDQSGTGEVTLVSYAPERVVLHTQNAAPALLVLSDSVYPGWQATVDDQPATIYPTDLLFRGVPVPAGEHNVVFTYRPRRWQRGRWLSGLGFLLWLGALAIWGYHRFFRAVGESGV